MGGNALASLLHKLSRKTSRLNQQPQEGVDRPRLNLELSPPIEMMAHIPVGSGDARLSIGDIEPQETRAVTPPSPVGVTVQSSSVFGSKASVQSLQSLSVMSGHRQVLK